MKNFIIMGVQWKIQFLGVAWKNNILGVNCLKKVAWTVCRFKKKGFARKRGDVFEGGVRPQCTLWVGGAFLLTQWFIGIKCPKSITLCHTNTVRSSHPEVFLRKGVLKICSKFTGEHPCRSAISIKLHSNFVKIALRHGCCPVNLLHIFRTLFLKNTSRRLLLHSNITNNSNYNWHIVSTFLQKKLLTPIKFQLMDW